MPLINLVMHPKQDEGQETAWERWELHINGLTEIQYCSLARITSELRKREYGSRHGKKSITAVYDVCGAGTGRFPPLSSVRPFLNEIRAWGFVLTHCSCPAPDEISMCILRKA